MKDQNKQETDSLEYQGYKVPIWVILPWIALAIYCVYYLLTYMVPDLKLWVNAS